MTEENDKKLMEKSKKFTNLIEEAFKLYFEIADEKKELFLKGERK